MSDSGWNVLGTEIKKMDAFFCPWNGPITDPITEMGVAYAFELKV